MMDWAEKLGVKEAYIFNQVVDEYFEKLGFYRSTMNPRFFDGQYDELTIDVPVLRFDGDWDWDGHGTQRVFINRHEVYVERQTSYRSFDGSRYRKFEQAPQSIGEVEDVLNDLVEKYEKY